MAIRAQAMRIYPLAFLIFSEIILGCACTATAGISKSNSGSALETRSSDVRSVYQRIRDLPPSEQRAKAALQVPALAPILEQSDEETTVDIADILRLAGCDAKGALPYLTRALERFPAPGPAPAEGDPMAMIVPSTGAWGALSNAISIIEEDNSCAQKIN
jgi:hypothetical protein